MAAGDRKPDLSALQLEVVRLFFARFHGVAPVTRQCSERTLAGKISRNYPCDPSAKVRPDAGSHRLVKVRLTDGPAGSVAPA